jgi:BlaI family transcriptional regulator, penicillinase repressor
MKESLSRRERQIMLRIYARGRATAEEIREDLADAVSNSAVRTFLSILEDKGFLRHENEGKRFIYLPIRPKEEAGIEALKDVVRTFFANSAATAVAALIKAPDGKIPAEEYQRLVSLIESAKPKGS